jgi:hypothetical protein
MRQPTKLKWFFLMSGNWDWELNNMMGYLWAKD